jgi:hypothetical protein
MKKIFKILGVFVCVICLIIFTKIFQNLIYSASSVTCLESKTEDSLHFGQALAITDNYIAVGDPEANLVAVYSYDESEDKWSRTREVYPPKNSIIDKVGSGFGSSLVFNQNQLIIGAYSDLVPSNLVNTSGIENNQNKYSYHGAVYSLLLDAVNQNTLKKISLPESIKLTGYSIVTFANKIAIEASTGTRPGQKPGKILIINPNTLKFETIIESLIPPAKQEYLGKNIAGNKNFLIVFSPDISALGGVYLVNEQGELVEKVSISEISNTQEKGGFDSPIALGDDFIAIYSGGWDGLVSIFKQSSSRWKEIYSVNLFGSLSADKSQLLVSAERYPFDHGIIHRSPNHLLIDARADRAFIRSTIRWQSSFYVGSAVAKGAINSKYLLLSRYGKVVLLKKNYIPRDYVINRSFCKEK